MYQLCLRCHYAESESAESHSPPSASSAALSCEGACRGPSPCEIGPSESPSCESDAPERALSKDAACDSLPWSTSPGPRRDGTGVAPDQRTRQRQAREEGWRPSGSLLLDAPAPRHQSHPASPFRRASPGPRRHVRPHPRLPRDEPRRARGVPSAAAGRHSAGGLSPPRPPSHRRCPAPARQCPAADSTPQ